jgi:adenylylsulfate kinase-like enzyme
VGRLDRDEELYAQARRGRLRGFIGVDDPYERPEHADVTVGLGPVDKLVQDVLDGFDLAVA